MTKPDKTFFCAIFLSSFLLVHGIGIGALVEVVDISGTIVNIADFLTGDLFARKISKLIDEQDMTAAATKSDLYEQFNFANIMIDELGQKIDRLELKLRNIQKVIRLELYTYDIYTAYTIINQYYNVMNNIVMDRRYENSTIINNAELFVSPGVNSPQQISDKIYTIFASGNENFLNSHFLPNIVTNLQEPHTELCELNQSPKNVLLSLYNSIILIELKAFAVMQFGYTVLKKQYGTNNKNMYNHEISQNNQMHRFRLKMLTSIFQNAMNKVSNEFLKCDPVKHVQGETFEEISPIVQGFVIHQDKLDPNGRCFDTCNSYQFHKIPTCKPNDFWCKMQRKCDKVVKCDSLGGDASVCLANKTSMRRYEFVQNRYGTFGKKNVCLLKKYSLTEYAYGVFWKCVPCFCYCQESINPNSERYISLRRSRSDIRNNKIVVGVRFIKRNKILHLQVQEAKLLPYGDIDASTIRWVPVNEFKRSSRQVYEGQDYHTFKYNEATVDLDNLKAPNGSIVTGVRFKRIGKHLNFELFITPFNYSSGELHPKKSVYIDNLSSTRTELKLHKPGVPTLCSETSKVDSHTNQYVEFTHSDVKSDAAQTTVPFFDTQPVVPSTPSILQGVGIYHKGQPNCGGFLGLRIFTYDHFQHVNLARVL